MIKFFLPLVLLLPGYCLHKFTKNNVTHSIERLSISYILSLAMIFLVLYSGGIMKAFNIASLLVSAITVVSLIYFLVLFARNKLCLPNLYLFFTHISTEKIVVVFSTIGLCIIYIIFLSTNAILGADVVQYYLPMAREIVNGNGFTYSTGYDYNLFLKPIGVSVLYAWTFGVSGSTFSESFRLMPLVPIFMLIILNYAITFSATKSSKIGVISTIIFCVLPFHDRFLLRTSFYPDIFYYPLIFSIIFFLLEYFQSKRSILLLWAGIGFGTASLLKAQTIYFLIAFILIFTILNLKIYKILSVILIFFTPLYILVPSILANSIQGNKILLSIPHFIGTQIGLFFLLSTLSGVSYYVIFKSDTSGIKIDSSTVTVFVKKIALLIFPLIVLSSLWYINNYLRFGSLIFTSSANIPNYSWARSITRHLKMPQTTGSIWQYAVYFLFVFVDPSVMGYTMLIPLLIGLLFVLRKRLENVNILLFYGIISASIILSTVISSLSSPIVVYNPRDILPLAPLLSTLTSIGIVSITSNFSTKIYDTKNVIASLLLISYFGLLNYIHSVYVWFIHLFHATNIGKLVSAFGNSVGLNLSQTSFQLSSGDRVIFVGENILRIVSLSLVAGIPVLLIMFHRHYKFFTRGYTIKVKIEPKAKKAILNTFTNFRSSRQWLWLKNIFTVFLMLSVIMIPRVEMLTVQGGPQNIQETQLRWNYGDVYELFANPSEFDGGILTYKAPMGLPYYLPDVKIIDLVYPANLAFLKDCFQSATPYEAVLMLREQNISYVLIHTSITRNLDASLNFTLSRIIQNPEYASLSRTFGSWKLYTLGPNRVEKISLPLSGWDIDPRYTNAEYYLNYDGERLLIELGSNITETDLESFILDNTDNRVTIMNYDLLKFNLSSYDYITADVEGSHNSRMLIRFWLNDGTNMDIAYWTSSYLISSTPFDLKPYYGKMLRGDIYIALISSDGLKSSIKISEISFVKIKD